MRHAYDRIQEVEDEDRPEAKFYLDAARVLYNAARRDAQADRTERSGELARAAEALTHVPEHLTRAEGPVAKGERPEPSKAKKKKGEGPEPKAKKGERPEPKVKKGERPDAEDDLPPPLPPRE